MLINECELFHCKRQNMDIWPSQLKIASHSTDGYARMSLCTCTCIAMGVLKRPTPFLSNSFETGSCGSFSFPALYLAGTKMYCGNDWKETH